MNRVRMPFAYLGVLAIVAGVTPGVTAGDEPVKVVRTLAATTMTNPSDLKKRILPPGTLAQVIREDPVRHQLLVQVNDRLNGYIDSEKKDAYETWILARNPTSESLFEKYQLSPGTMYRFGGTDRWNDIAFDRATPSVVNLKGAISLLNESDLKELRDYVQKEDEARKAKP